MKHGKKQRKRMWNTEKTIHITAVHQNGYAHQRDEKQAKVFFYSQNHILKKKTKKQKKTTLMCKIL